MSVGRLRDVAVLVLPGCLGAGAAAMLVGIPAVQAFSWMILAWVSAALWGMALGLCGAVAGTWLAMLVVRTGKTFPQSLAVVFDLKGHRPRSFA